MYWKCIHGQGVQSRTGETFGRERGTCKGSLWEPEDSDTSAPSLPYTQPCALDCKLLAGGRGHFFPFVASGLGRSMVYSEELIKKCHLGKT